MSETPDLVRRLYDHCTTTCTLDLDAWVTFMAEQGVEPQQVESVLIAVLGHLCTLAGELTEETNRLAHALARRR
jgi:hypothetical protein